MTLMRRKEKFARALLAPINPSLAILLGVYTVLWGLWVANPFWHVFKTAGLYSKLSAFSLAQPNPEVFWGCIAITCGLFTCYGAIKRHYRPLVRGAAVAGWHWFMISIFYFWGDWQNTGGITALVISIYAVFVFLNVRVNFKDDPDSPAVLR